MNTETLPESVIKEDRRLSRSAEELCELRWHWTVDGSNPKRISIREYARQVGVSRNSVSRDANAWEQYLGHTGVSGPGKPSTIDDFRAAQDLSEQRQQATEAIAQQTGKSYAAVAKHHRDEVNAVVEMAHDRMERKGSTFEHEVHKVAENRQAHSERIKQQKNREKQHMQAQCLKMQLCLGYAVNRVREAYNIAQELDQFGEEEIEFLAHSLQTLRAFLNLLDRRIVGKENVDWDAELQKLVREYEGKEA